MQGGEYSCFSLTRRRFDCYDRQRARAFLTGGIGLPFFLSAGRDRLSVRIRSGCERCLQRVPAKRTGRCEHAIHQDAGLWK